MASKLSDRMHSYFRFSDLGLKSIKPVKRKDVNGTDLVRRLEEENISVQKVQDFLKVSKQDARNVPWSAKLDRTMFYL
jgi:hypothetical protein